MPLCRQTAVGPVLVTSAIVSAPSAACAARTRDREPFSHGQPLGSGASTHKAAATAPSANRAIAANRHTPVADSQGIRPKPPANDPTIAPSVLAAYARPTCVPTASRPRPKSAINSGNWKPATIAVGNTTTAEH